MEENSFKINKNKNEKNDINENNIEDDNKFKEDLTKKFMDYEEFKIKDFSKLSSINNLQKDKNTILIMIMILQKTFFNFLMKRKKQPNLK